MPVTGRRREPDRPMSIEQRIRLTAGEEAMLAAFAERRRHLSGFAEERAVAIERLARHGLPTRRNEAWKFSDARAALKEFPLPSGLPSANDLAKVLAAPKDAVEDATRLVFVNGRFNSELSAVDMPEGVYFRDLTQAFERGDAYAEAHLGRLMAGNGDTALALHNAFVQGGAVLRIAPNTRVEAPIYLDFRFIGAPASVFPRLLLLVGEGAEATLIDTYRGPDGVAYQSHSAFEVTIGAGARLLHVTEQAEGDRAIALAHGFVELGRDALYETFTLDDGAAFQRRALSTRFIGEGARLMLNGAVLARGAQHADTTLNVDHAFAGGVSREIFKYVLADKAQGVFQGKIIVRPDAQKTDGRMNARGLLIGDEAEFSAKPELEIFADDVQCAHGATAGQIDEDLAFYLRSRGLPEAEARGLLVRAFVGEAVEAVCDEAIRDWLQARIGLSLDRMLGRGVS